MADHHPTALVTGGTGSLGLSTAQTIHDAGWNVILTGRNQRHLADAVNRVGPRAIGVHLDLCSLAQVRHVSRDLPPLDAIVCNAGVHTVSGTAYTRDGIEQTFGVNHLAHFLLVHEVLPTMIKPARIALVSSGTHDPARHTGFPPPRYTEARDLAFPGTTTESTFEAGRRAYTTAKLCAVLFAHEFARRISPTIATCNVFDPGQMPGTGIARDYPRLRRLAWRYVLPALTVVPGNSIHTPRRSAAGLARLVLDPSHSAVTGRYFEGRREGRSSADSYDTAKAADLWETSTALITTATGQAPTPLEARWPTR